MRKRTVSKTRFAACRDADDLPAGAAPMTFETGTRGPSVPASPALLRLLAKMPPGVLATFSPAQLHALAQSAERASAPHLMDFLVSLPFLGRRYYLRLYVGRERRSYERLLREGQISLGRVLLVWSWLAWMILSLVALGTVVMLYVLKSQLGINIFQGQSPLHFLYETIYR
jgi:hypothetical protein